MGSLSGLLMLGLNTVRLFLKSKEKKWKPNLRKKNLLTEERKSEKNL